MMNWRKWLPWVGIAIAVGIGFASGRIAGAVVHAVGVEAIRTHAVLTVVLAIGLGVLLSLLTLLLPDPQRNTRKVGIGFAIFYLLIGCFNIYVLYRDVPHFFLHLGRPEDYASLADGLTDLFFAGVLSSIFLLMGIQQFITWRRQQQAQPGLGETA